MYVEQYLLYFDSICLYFSGTIFRLKGSILAMSFLDCNGVLIPRMSEQWKDLMKEKDREREKLQSSKI